MVLRIPQSFRITGASPSTGFMSYTGHSLGESNPSIRDAVLVFYSLRRLGQGDTSSNSLTRLIAFHIALIPLGKVWIQLFSFQQWINSWADWSFQHWLGNQCWRRKTLNLVKFVKTWPYVTSCLLVGIYTQVVGTIRFISLIFIWSRDDYVFYI